MILFNLLIAPFYYGQIQCKKFKNQIRRLWVKICFKPMPEIGFMKLENPVKLTKFLSFLATIIFFFEI